ncbi:unnamed protein product [Ceutorhynchus assimilis]|uniref:GATA zinc finger domain-containing protein 1 n=1 Tax=Ceutorhynchus assimilis TaxID=467358 RepID=A0A9N9QK03_9CUCU|nr:unnamed protein product [Ceutorhynchus assimilis]
MPNNAPVVCLKCEATESSFWTKADELGVICLDCVTKDKKDKETEEAGGSKGGKDGKSTQKQKARAGKSSNTQHNPIASSKQSSVSKARGRRSIFKNVPKRVPTVEKTDRVLYKGSYFQTGDIVSVTGEDSNYYYAQIIGLMTDEYCNKSAVIQWLLPTTESPPPNEEFDPATYIIGPAEDMARDLEYFEFVMHAPSDYYKSKAPPHAPAVL